MTESAVHSLVHPCCASVNSGSNPIELRRFITGANCVGVERRSRAPWHRDELRDDCHRGTAQLTSATYGNRWQQQFVSDNDSCAGWVQVAGFRDHNLRGAF